MKLTTLGKLKKALQLLSQVVEELETPEQKCHGTLKSGKPCGAHTQHESGFCKRHQTIVRTDTPNVQRHVDDANARCPHVDHEYVLGTPLRHDCPGCKYLKSFLKGTPHLQ